MKRHLLSFYCRVNNQAGTFFFNLALILSLLLAASSVTDLKGQYDPVVVSGTNTCFPAGSYPFFLEFDKPMFADVNSGFNIFWDTELQAWTAAFGEDIYFQINEDTPLPPCGEWVDISDCGGTFIVSGECTELAPTACPAAGGVWYVDAAAGPDGDGTSWDCAFQDLQTALIAAAAGEEIWIATGTYVPGASRGSRFNLKEGVSLFGGFPSIGNPGMADRDASEYPTILSGEIGDPQTVSDNVFHVVFGGSGLSEATIIDGLIVEHGNANGAQTDRLGGGLFLESGSNGQVCNPIFRNCIIRNNNGGTGGGALIRGFNGGSAAPRFEHCTFLQNTGEFGHAAFFGGVAAPVFEDCLFDQNSGVNGILVVADGAIFNNCSFTNNSATSKGPSILAEGTVTITNCLFEGNSGSNEGALRIESGDVEVSHCTFRNNQSNTFGGGITVANADPTIRNCIFSQNTSAWAGGAVSNDNASGLYINCIFEDNLSQNGAAVFNNGNGARVARPTFINCLFDSNTASGQGGAMLNEANAGQDAVPVIINSTFYGNSAGSLGNAICNANGGSAVLRNSIMYGNGGVSSIFNTGNGLLDAAHSLFDQTVTGYSLSPSNFTAAESPFVDAPNDDFELNDCAAAIDRGDNAAYLDAMGAMEDLSGKNRLYNASGLADLKIDMGALEFEGSPVPLLMSCQTTYSVVLGPNGEAELDASVFDSGSTGCSPLTFELDGEKLLSLGCNDVGEHEMTLQLTDGRHEVATCVVTLSVSDESAPSAACLNPTVLLDGNGSYQLQESDVFDALNSSDNCGITAVDFEALTFDCQDVGQTAYVLVNVRDAAGLEASCLSAIQVESSNELPEGWSPTDIGDAGEGTTYSFDICAGDNPNQAGLDISTGAYNLFPRNADNVAFVTLPLCGDGGIQARIDQVSNGYAGLMIRESSHPGAKMVAIYSNQTSIVRREIRSVDNADKSVGLILAPAHQWLRLVRSGNYIGGFYRNSAGGSWQLFFLAYLPMQNCVEMGIAAFTHDPNGTADVSFSQIRYSSNAGENLSTPERIELESWEPPVVKATIAPNPVRDVMTLTFSRPLFADGTATLFNEVGQRVGQMPLREGASTLDWVTGQLPAGFYFLHLKGENGYQEVLKVVKH